MRGLLSRKGFSLVELLVVLVILLLLITIISMAVIGYIDDARGSTLTNNARSVYYAAQVALMENNEYISDYDLALGLSGTITDSSQPAQVRLSQRMNELLAPDIVLSNEPHDSKVTFEINDGQIVSCRYEAQVDNRRYAVTVPAGGQAVVERIK